MSIRELIAELLLVENLDREVQLEVGGDGAVHRDPPRQIYYDGNRVVVSGEPK